MKIERFNESNIDVLKERVHKAHKTSYKVIVSSEDGENLVDTSTYQYSKIEDAIETYNRISKKLRNYEFCYIIENKILSDEEIELLTNTNKYNL